MTDIKISQLTNVSSNNLTDLFEISRNLGGGNFESRSIQYHDLLHSLLGQEVLTVGSDGADTTTIKEGIQHALAAIVPPSITNPIVILVQPGIYTEDNPLTVPSYVSIVAIGGSEATTVIAQNPTQPIFDMETVTTLVGLHMSGANGVGGVGVEGTGFQVTLKFCDFTNCETGVLSSTGAAIRMTNVACLNTPGMTMTNALKMEAGGQILIANLAVVGTPASIITNAIYCTGSGSEITAPSGYLQYCTNGLYVNDGGIIDADSFYIYDCVNAVRVGSTGAGSRIITLATSILRSTSYDVLIESVDGELDFTGKLDVTKRSVISGSHCHILGLTPEPEGVYITGELVVEDEVNIGIPGSSTTNLDVGEGGSYNSDENGTEIVEYWNYDASAASGSRFARCANNAGTQLTDNGDAIIVGSKFAFSATRMDVLSAANLGSSSIVTEHWNGSGWTENTIAVYKKSDMTHRSDQPFQNVETQYIEFNTGINDDWDNDRDTLDEVPNWDTGINMYPLRFRNNTASMVTGMTFQDGRVRGDDFQVTPAKETVNWGRHRGTEANVVLITAMSPDIVNPPGTIAVSISPNISRSFPSEFTDGAVCSMGYALTLPVWIDTSTPITLRIPYFVTNTNVGNINFNVRIVSLGIGFVFDGTASETVYSVITAATGSANVSLNVDQELDCSACSPGNIFFVAIERDATAGNPLDTYVGDVVLISNSLVYTRKIVG